MVGKEGELTVVLDPGAFGVSVPLNIAYDPARLEVTRVEGGDLPGTNAQVRVEVTHTPALGWITAAWKDKAVGSGTLVRMTVRPRVQGEIQVIFAGPIGAVISKGGHRGGAARRRGRGSPVTRACRGFTVAELVMVTALLAVLAAVALPTGRFMQQREREWELRLDLRLMRNAIDDHKRLADQGMIQIELGTEGYPKTLEELVEGISIVGQVTKRKFLRRIPVDPMTGKAEWGLRSYQDSADSTSWGGQNVYDVYSLSEGTGARRHQVQGLVAMRQGQRDSGTVGNGNARKLVGAVRVGMQLPTSSVASVPSFLAPWCCGQAGRRGFTLIELIVVVAIIGILATIAVPAMKTAPQRAREAALKEDLFTLRSCLDQFHADRGRLPDLARRSCEPGLPARRSGGPGDPLEGNVGGGLRGGHGRGERASAGGRPGNHRHPLGSEDNALDGTRYADW